MLVHSKKLSVVALVLAVASIALAASFFLRTKTTPEGTLGSKLYSSHCASCHGAHLEGQPNWQVPNANGRLPAPPHDSSGHTWHHSDWELFVITKYGMSALVPQHVSDMPAFENILTDAEIRAILAFIKSQWPNRERKYQELRNENSTQQ